MSGCDKYQVEADVSDFTASFSAEVVVPLLHDQAITITMTEKIVTFLKIE